MSLLCTITFTEEGIDYPLSLSEGLAARAEETRDFSFFASVRGARRLLTGIIQREQKSFLFTSHLVVPSRA